MPWVQTGLEFLYRIPPGILTLVLAVIAAVSALPKVAEWIKNSWWGHASVVFVFFFIAAAEGMLIRHADKVSEERIATLEGHVIIAVTNTTEIQKTLAGYINSQNIYEQAQFEKRQHHKISDELIQLKGTTSSLAAEIFRFLLARSLMAPPPPRPATWEQDIAKSMPFDNQTVLFYEQTYGAKVRMVVNDLSKHGLKDETLEGFVGSPNNVMVLRMIANHLTVQAERIAPDGIQPPIDQRFMD